MRGALVALALVVAACSGGGSAPTTSGPPPIPPGEVTSLLNDLEQRTFEFFWTSTNPSTGLTPDRYPSASPSSIAAIGFALTAYPIGVERGYVSRADAATRVLTTLQFLTNAPQGAAANGMSGYQGFFYHFLDTSTGMRYQMSELSTIDTALLMAGVLFAESYFDGATADETTIRSVADALYRRVNWAWAADSSGLVALSWTPESGFNPLGWRGYNEAMILYVLGLGSPTFPLPAAAWQAWSAGYGPLWQTQYGQTFLTFPPLFGHQYSHVWIDFRGIQDSFMRGKGSDYFINSRAATYAQQAYAIANPLQWRDYGSTIFGLTACDGPGTFTVSYDGQVRQIYGYIARGMGGTATNDDGTIAPTAALSSIAFAPDIVLPALAEMESRYGGDLYSTYGFVDAFNPSIPDGAPVTAGHVVSGSGWFDTDYLGIDQGPILAMAENYRSELVWSVMRSNPYVRNGLIAAGFSGGWLPP